MRKLANNTVCFLLVGIAAMWSGIAGGAGPEEPGTIELLRTPDARFENLPGYDFEPHYVFVDDPTGSPGNARIRVHYTYSGPAGAPTLLLMHGNPSWSYLFREIVPLITKAGYRTVMFDYVGMGRSDKPTRESDFSYDRHLEWIRQIVEALDADPELQLGRVVLMGHDYGHPFGARLIAEHYPDRFDGFINGNAGLNRGLSGLSPRHDKWRNFVRRAPIVPIGRIVCANPSRMAAGLSVCSEEIQAGWMAPYPGREYQAAIRHFPEIVPEDVTWPEAKANQHAWDHLTARFTKPYMVIWENWDLPDARRNRRAEYIEQIPGAFGREQPQFKTGHYSPEDNPEGVAAAVVRFLDDIYVPNDFEEVLRTDFSSGLERLSCQPEPCAQEGNRKAIRLGAPDVSLVQSSSMDLSAAQEIKVAFRFLPEATDQGDKLLVDLWSGEDWTQILSIRRGAEIGDGDFFNGSTDYGYVRVGREKVSFAADARIRLRTQFAGSRASILIKELGVYTRP